MAIPAAGYEYEADAAADGVLHYWPFYDLFNGLNSIDTIGNNTLITYNDAGGITLEKAMFGHCRNLTANGTGLNHSTLVKETESANNLVLYTWTVAMWFNPTTLVTVDGPRILDMTGLNGFQVYFGFPGSVDTVYVDFTDALIATMSQALSLATGTNHLLVVSSDDTAGSVSVYIDDTLVATDTASSQPLSLYDARWYVGGSSFSTSSGEYFDGRVDELSIYNKALDVTDRGTLWNAGAGMVNDLVKYANKPRLFPTEVSGFADAVKLNFASVAADIIGANVVNEGLLKAVAFATDTPDIGDTIVALMRALPIAGDTVGLEDVFVENLRTGRSVSEDFGFITSFSVSGEIYDGVVMNTQNSAVTEYDQVPYNSVAKIDTGVYAAAAADGIYYMEGGLDDNANIDAYITTKLMNFGESKFKRVERAYVAMSNDGPMVLKVITRNALGTLSEDWYELSNTSDTMRTDRIKIGKGLKSHYWQFTLANNAGADFDLSELNFKQIRLSRRV